MNITQSRSRPIERGSNVVPKGSSVCTRSMRTKKENPGQLAKTVNLFGVDFWLVTRGNVWGKEIRMRCSARNQQAGTFLKAIYSSCTIR